MLLQDFPNGRAQRRSLVLYVLRRTPCFFFLLQRLDPANNYSASHDSIVATCSRANRESQRRRAFYSSGPSSVTRSTRRTVRTFTKFVAPVRTNRYFTFLPVFLSFWSSPSTPGSPHPRLSLLYLNLSPSFLRALLSVLPLSFPRR